MTVGLDRKSIMLGTLVIFSSEILRDMIRKATSLMRMTRIVKRMLLLLKRIHFPKLPLNVGYMSYQFVVCWSEFTQWR